MTIGRSGRPDFVDLNKMVGSMTREIDSFWSISESDYRNNPRIIHKVPDHITENDRNAYEPIILSIGPYYSGSPNLIAMEKEKWKSLDYILKLNCKVSLQDYIRAVSKLGKEVRSCYSEHIRMDKKKFMQILLLDACFILVKADGTVLAARPTEDPFTEDTGQGITDTEANCSYSSQAIDGEIEQGAAGNTTESLVPEIGLRNTHDNNVEKGSNKTDSNHGFQQPHDGDWYAVSTWHDLFLLENQIPFFVIETVYELAVSNGLKKAMIRDKIVECIEDVLRQFPKGNHKSEKIKRHHHMLHLCHIYLSPTQKFVRSQQKVPKTRYFHSLVHFGRKYFSFGSNLEESEVKLLPVRGKDCFRAGQLPTRWRRASQYHEAGVSLKKREYNEFDKHSLLDLKFSDGVVEIPCLPLDENSESLFKNLIALEQTNGWFGNDITAYVFAMSQLVSTSEDATLLAEKGIIMHLLGSDDEIPALFVRLTKQVTFYADGNYYLKYLCQSLEAHYQSRLNRWIAWLWLNHFSNPWLALAMVAMIIVLLCTLVQTIYTVLAYTNPPS